MEKYLAAVLLTLSFSVNAKIINGTIPVVCADENEFVDAITQFNEEPFITASSSRDMGEKVLVPTPMVIFLNPKTGTFTIAEKIADMYCVVAMGENMKPFIAEDKVRSSY